MKFVHVVEAWKGGVATYLEALIHQQLACGYQVYLVCDEKVLHQDQRSIEGCQLITYESSRNPFHFIGISRQIKRILEEVGADVVHFHSSFPGVYGRIQKHQCKVFYSPHSWGFSQRNVSKLKLAFFSIAERILSGNCTKIICISRDELNSAKRIGIKGRKLELVYTGIKDKQISVPAGQADSSLKVGFFGRLDHQKGFDILLGAESTIKRNVEIHVYGDSVRSEVLEDYQGRFIFHGWVDSERVSEEMAGLDLIVMPSRWEGFAIVPLESMRAGKGLIVSNQSSLPEVVIDGYNGLVLKSNESQVLAEAINSLSLIETQQLGVNARKVYEKCFSFDMYYRKLEGIYLE
ncbi:glycosyltransferase [Agarivorans aestuarii]|uniref:glycosyltransferase n=1 Tax=Agarivorans aestuarii TaxID=1563703 RepID=UPI001C7F6790|nr:glycosyltransferase [Agarivorans aestuarii]